MKSYRLTNQLFDKTNDMLGKHARDVQLAFNQIPVTEQRILDSKYIEPLALACVEEPFAIELVRIASLTQPQIPVRCGGMVHFFWDGASAQITSIDGLSPADSLALEFRFSFRITYRTVS